MARIAVVATYYNRQEQLNKTLLSMCSSKHKDFEVIIVDDCSDKEIIPPILPLKISVLRLSNKTWNNTASVYNEGFLEALKRNPDIIILQNAECYHEGDVIQSAEKVTEKNYIAYSCYSLAKGEEPGIVLNDRVATCNGDSAWYNHPVHRPCGYHFCAAITADNLRKLNGFDERFCEGIAYEDDYFVHQVRNLGLTIEIPRNPFVFHQYHYDGLYRDPALVQKNEALWNELKGDSNYRAIHKLTKDL